MNKTHGRWGTPIYKAWAQMKDRCYNPNNLSYKDYGGRGIMVCDRWRNSFMAFYKDMGEKPFHKAQIDRIDNDGNYEPENCRWTTSKINSQNQRSTKLSIILAKQIRKEYISRIVTQRMLARKYGVTQGTIGFVLRGVTWICILKSF